MKKKILIVGSTANAYSLAKYFASNSDNFEVYVAPGNDIVSEFATKVDIREQDVSELLKFAITNSIDLTIAVSKEAIRADIAGYFRENSQQIFAPEGKCSNFTTSRATAKKFLYRQHINVPKFGIFEKQQLANDYIKTAQYPLLITTDNDNELSVRAVCTSITQAQTCINDIFNQDEERAIIEEYIYGHPFTLYVISDGYQVLPICPVGDYRFLEDGEGGCYTQGIGAFAPDYKVPCYITDAILNNEISRIIGSLQKNGCPYVGILGVEAVLKSNDTYVITGFTPFFKEHDTDVVLSIIDSDLYAIMEACANGSFADDYDEILTSPVAAISCVLSSRINNSVIYGLEDDDETILISHFGTRKNKYFEYLANKGRVMAITAKASTISIAKERLYETIDTIKFDGKKYRKDICAG